MVYVLVVVKVLYGWKRSCCLESCDVHVSMLTLLFDQPRPLSYGFIILVSRYQLLRQVTLDDTSGERL